MDFSILAEELKKAKYPQLHLNDQDEVSIKLTILKGELTILPDENNTGIFEASIFYNSETEKIISIKNVNNDKVEIYGKPIDYKQANHIAFCLMYFSNVGLTDEIFNGLLKEFKLNKV